MYQWKCLPFESLSNHQLYELLKLRVDVFVVEQNCPYPELDGKDTLTSTYHLLGYQGDELVACARLLDKDVSYAGASSIGRIATKASARGHRLGHKLMEQALTNMETLFPDHVIEIGAQEHLQGFYNQHGFIAYSDSYLEDGIPHIDMRRAVSQ
ncbi:GNAT family N-acetyltransferase [Vibrio sp. SCSIO 43136]|uniref:GNAT family N-acetyltransferase n=1 Tax=Vibrio sp. SCSIO 43136 TaxID=2819101 RepID=UPI002075DDF4|nr:GNAT family N-acetyltransferase [Vibrio sp. SCSIO 43136]USD65566.1 GNAT family N-acetyltransferase [Vibrio sp. SCSIO 43136]